MIRTIHVYEVNVTRAIKGVLRFRCVNRQMKSYKVVIYVLSVITLARRGCIPQEEGQDQKSRSNVTRQDQRLSGSLSG